MCVCVCVCVCVCLYLDALVVAVHRAQTGQVAKVTRSSRAGRLLRRSYVFWKKGVGSCHWLEQASVLSRTHVDKYFIVCLFVYLSYRLECGGFMNTRLNYPKHYIKYYLYTFLLLPDLVETTFITLVESVSVSVIVLILSPGFPTGW